MPTNLYGPGDNYHPQNSHVLPALIRKFYEAKSNNSPFVECWGSGNPLREFLHVNDLAEACFHALQFWDPFSSNAPKNDHGEVLGFLNVGTGLDLSIKELANKIAKYVEYEGEIRWDITKPDGTFKKQLDISRILKLGWSPKIDIDKGIKKTIFEYEKKILSNNIRI